MNEKYPNHLSVNIQRLSVDILTLSVDITIAATAREEEAGADAAPVGAAARNGARNG